MFITLLIISLILIFIISYKLGNDTYNEIEEFTEYFHKQDEKRKNEIMNELENHF